MLYVDHLRDKGIVGGYRFNFQHFDLISDLLTSFGSFVSFVVKKLFEGVVLGRFREEDVIVGWEVENIHVCVETLG